MKSLTASTLSNYQKSWARFYEFGRKLGLGQAEVTMPISPQIIALFVAYLYNQDYKAPSMRNHLSAISFYHKINNLPSPTDSFLIEKLLRGAGVQSPGGDARLPITLPLLQRLLNVIQGASRNSYERCLFMSMCCTAFYAFLRCSEYTVSPHCLLFENIHMEPDGTSMTVKFVSYKHMKGNQPFLLRIEKKPENFCPVALMAEYLKVREKKEGPLFTLPGKYGVSRSFFTSRLKGYLKACKLDIASYKAHSFRIGAATHALLQGKSDSQIEILGRWSSNSYKKYLRVAGISSI